MARLILIIAVLIVVYLVLRSLANTSPEKLAKFFKRAGIWILVGGLILLAATGRLNWLFALIGAGVALGARLFKYVHYLPAIHRLMRGLGLASPGGKSDSQSVHLTQFLLLRINPLTGAMQGQVRSGTQSGHSLNELDLDSLMTLRQEFQVDPQSLAMLEAWLDYAHQGIWRQQAGADTASAHATPDAEMSRIDAYAVLGLEEDASVEEIKFAHKRLMQKLHPDRGGSTWLATRINQARDRLS